MGFVYVITNGAGLNKIGSSGDPPSRLRQLQTGSSDRLSIVFQIATPHAVEIEREAHSILRSHRLVGEWFAVDKEMAIAAVFGAASRLGHSFFTESQPSASQGQWKLSIEAKLAIVAIAFVVVKIYFINPV